MADPAKRTSSFRTSSFHTACMRTQQVRKGNSSDQWIVINARDWDWDDEAQHWDPGKTERLYRLTPEKLRHAYEGLATA